MPESNETLRQVAALLGITELLHIVDIGANPIGAPPPLRIAAGGRFGTSDRI